MIECPRTVDNGGSAFARICIPCHGSVVTGEPAGIDGVSATALGAAMMRAQESARPDRLFGDPLAAAFVAAAPAPFEDVPDSGDGELAALEAAFGEAMVIRTRFFDDYLAAACSAGCRQVVLLGAGLDTRAFRLHWPEGVQLFELDLAEMLAFKEAVLRQQGAHPRCTRRVVPVDLRSDWPSELLAAGFARSAPTAWTAEGLLAYLAHDEAAHLLARVGELSHDGSQLSFERASFAGDSVLSDARAMPAMEEVTSMWKGGLGGDAGEWLEQRGWRVRTSERLALAQEYGRPMTTASEGGFVTATRRSRSDRGRVGG